MVVKLGHFIKDEAKEKANKIKSFTKKFTFDDSDECDEDMENFVQFSNVELSLQGLKYGPKYKNILNGLMFKQTKPHLVGNLRLIIRINKESNIDIYSLKLTKYLNVRDIKTNYHF